MRVVAVDYTKNFKKQFSRLTPELQRAAAKAEIVFCENPLHNSLRLHQLGGKLSDGWSISITGSYRIIFTRDDDGSVTFVAVGPHYVYKHFLS